MNPLKLIIIALLTSFIHADEKPETAWINHPDHLVGGPFVYGSVQTAPDFIRRLSRIDTPDDDDPFGPDDPKKATAHRAEIDKIAPLIPRNQLPDCITPHANYRDLSSLLKGNGVALKGDEWAIGSDSTVYFCTSLGNADIITQIFDYRCCGGPRTITQLMTLISIKNQKLENTAWTFDSLSKLKPTVHARYGLQGRSGEKISTILTQKDSAKFDYEIEPTLGENGIMLDCRLTITSSLLDPKVIINQQTAFTMSIETPFVIDCGNRGVDQRNYFLIISSKSEVLTHHHPENIDVHFKKIQGPYAMRHTSGKATPTKSNLPARLTKSYHTDVGFLLKFRQIINSDINGSFSDSNDRKQPSPPLLVSGLETNEHHQASDQVFDITPHLSLLGITTFAGEWVYFNRTRNQMIIHGSPCLQKNVSRFMKESMRSPRIVKLKARIIAVDHSGLEAVDWSLEKVEQSNPIYLADYSTVCRSGEKATCGQITYTGTEKDPESGEDSIDYGSEFEVEPVIGESNEWVDLRYYIESKPLGDTKTSIKVTTAAAIKDGTPTIIELGHTSKASRTHLLILNADIITPDGSLYRDRFKPVK